MKRVLSSFLAAAFVASLSDVVLARERVAIGTGGTGGVFYAVGAGMAELLSDELEGVSANAEVTGASIENIRRVSAGQMALGFSSASTLYAGLEGEDPFEAPQNVAAVAYLYPAVLQVAASAGSGADSLDGFADLDVGVGPPGSNSSVLSMRLLEAVGALNERNLQFLSYTEATGAMKDGNLDASMILAGVPAAAFIELFTTTDASLVPVDGAELEGLLADFPYHEMIEIPGGVYAGEDAPVTALGDPAILFTAADADPDLVFRITEALFDNLGTLGEVHPAAKQITREGATATPIPLHPGAARYFGD